MRFEPASEYGAPKSTERLSDVRGPVLRADDGTLVVVQRSGERWQDARTAPPRRLSDAPQ